MSIDDMFLYVVMSNCLLHLCDVDPMFLEGFSPSWMALMMILNFICANCVYQRNYFEISNHIYCFAVTRTLQTELFPSIPDLSLSFGICRSLKILLSRHT